MASILGWIPRIKEVKIVEQKNDEYDITSIGNIKLPETLKDENAFLLANSVPEIFFPIDFYADRISKLRFFIANKNGKEVIGSELNRLFNINPIYKFSDLIYQYVFSLLSDGNAVTYRNKPSIYSEQKITANNLSRVDLLVPGFYSFNEYSNINVLELNNYNEALKNVEYISGSKIIRINNPEFIQIDNYNLIKKTGSVILSKSPLFESNKSIDTLLAVYSARYNVYSNNGAAGYLAKKQSANNQSIEAQIAETGNKRDEILTDINNRNGLTGKRNLWGISGVPIEFVKTLATISELMPLEETLEASIKIASTFQIPPVLVPRKDQSTYDNQAVAERTVWENGLISLAETVASNWTNILGLTNMPYKIGIDYSNVSCLMQNASEKEALIQKKLANLQTIKQLSPDIDITKEINLIFSEYGK